MKLLQLLQSPTKFQSNIHEKMKLFAYELITELKEDIRNENFNFCNEISMSIAGSSRGFIQQEQGFRTLQKDYPEIFQVLQTINPEIFINSFNSFTSIEQNETNIIIDFPIDFQNDFLKAKRMLNNNTNVKDVIVKRGRMLVAMEGIIREAKFERTTRIRGGQIQRRKKVSTDKNFDASGRRMSAKERKNRALAQKKGARKRKSKQGAINRARKKSDRIRKRIGA